MYTDGFSWFTVLVSYSYTELCNVIYHEGENDEHHHQDKNAMFAYKPRDYNEGFRERVKSSHFYELWTQDKPDKLSFSYSSCKIACCCVSV